MKNRLVFNPVLSIVIIVMITTAFSVYGIYAGPKIPDMTFTTTDGEQKRILDIGDKRFGVLMYGSDTPCKGHIPAMKSNAKAYDVLMKSENYYPVLVYGDEKADRALDFAKKLKNPVYLDPGRKLAKKLGIKYYLTAVFDNKGKVYIYRPGICLSPRKNLPDLIDEDLRKMKKL